MTDCVVLTDDGGVEEALGSTHAEKSMAEVHSPRRSSHQRTAHRRARRNDDKKKGEGEKNLKVLSSTSELLLGNARTTQGTVAAHTVNEVILATGPGGKAKGFGWFIAGRTKERSAGAIDNTEVEAAESR